MSDSQEITGPIFGPAAGGSPGRLVVLLHGWGADGNDLIGLAPIWADLLPDALFLSPHAPFVCDIGMGRQWFSLEDRRPHVMRAGVETAAPILNRFLDGALAQHGLDADRLALVGFSQGTMMSLFVAPRRDRACACVLGYSGALFGGEELPQEIKSRPPVMLIHGEADPIVAASALPHAADGLAAAGIQVDSHLRPGLGHGIDEEGLRLGGAFLTSSFGLTPAAAQNTSS
ncbi:MAG: dienelactone hydrolase family protein [Alphaproteobacteria bacterium]|nr:dienelactone hydrolase family protein [Alphaproteobacteria bacterium]